MLVDEVITGFGRTGPLFACEAEGVTPDFLTTAKGLTSGYAPMGAMFMANHIYDTIADASPLPVGHGMTYSGHPVSAAVALEVLRLYREGGVLANGVETGKRFAERMEAIRSHPLVGDVRYRGMLGAIELVTDKGTKGIFPAELNLGDRLSQMTWDNGVIVRCFANAVIGFAPALTCTPDEMDIIFDRVQLSLDQLLEQADIRAALG